MPITDAKRAYDAVYRAANRERIAARMATYNAAHNEEISTQKAQYRAKHAEVRRQKNAAYRAAHQTEIKTQNARRYVEKYEVIRARNEAWRLANPDAGQMQTSRRRAEKAKARIIDLTLNQWESIKALYEGGCAYCEEKPLRLTQDHVMPLAAGGNHTASNIVPACKACNVRKGNGLPPVPIESLRFISGALHAER